MKVEVLAVPCPDSSAHPEPGPVSIVLRVPRGLDPDELRTLLRCPFLAHPWGLFLPAFEKTSAGQKRWILAAWPWGWGLGRGWWHPAVPSQAKRNQWPLCPPAKRNRVPHCLAGPVPSLFPLESAAKDILKCECSYKGPLIPAVATASGFSWSRV